MRIYRMNKFERSRFIAFNFPHFCFYKIKRLLDMQEITPYMQAVIDVDFEKARQIFLRSVGWSDQRIAEFKNFDLMKYATEIRLTTLDEKSIKAIELAVSNGYRAEVVPVKDGLKVLRVKRETVFDSNKK